MAFIALVIFLMGFTLFNVGGTVPESGVGVATQVQPSRAGLMIMQVSPLTVTGRSFRPGERVRVSAERARKSVVAGTRGRFTVTFPNVNACNGVSITAVGSSGSRASLSYAQIAKILCVSP